MATWYALLWWSLGVFAGFALAQMLRAWLHRHDPSSQRLPAHYFFCQVCGLMIGSKTPLFQIRCPKDGTIMVREPQP